MAENRIVGADGKPVKVDGVVEIICTDDGSEAKIILHSPLNGGKDFTVEGVKKELTEKGIVFGINEALIKKSVEEHFYGTPFSVASSEPPRKGANGYITYRFDKEQNLRPHQNEFGITNYRELNKITPIRKNDVIADITKPEEGIPGTNVFGKSIPAEPGSEPKISLGKNTLLTTDGTKIIAACDGHIIYAGGRFQVEEAVTIKTDLDISVGNISFFGDVHIKGNVMEGFSVNAGKNIKIDGSVFGGEISAGGNVTIVGGCINSKVTCDGSCDIGFCEKSEIFVKGDAVSKQYVFCNVFCYGAVSTKGAGGVISGGKITSMHDINAAIIGSEKYTPTEINIGDGSVLFARRREAESNLNEAERIYDLSVKNLAFLKQRKNMQNGVLTDAQQRQMRTETQNKLVYAMKKTELEELIASLDNDIRQKDNLSASCGMIYPGVKFCINFLTLEINEISARCRVTIVDDKLAVVPT